MLQKSTKMRSMHFFTAAFHKKQLTSVTNSRQTFILCMLLPVSKKNLCILQELVLIPATLSDAPILVVGKEPLKPCVLKDNGQTFNMHIACFHES